MIDLSDVIDESEIGADKIYFEMARNETFAITPEGKGEAVTQFCRALVFASKKDRAMTLEYRQQNPTMTEYICTQDCNEIKKTAQILADKTTILAPIFNSDGAIDLFVYLTRFSDHFEKSGYLNITKFKTLIGCHVTVCDIIKNAIRGC